MADRRPTVTERVFVATPAVGAGVDVIVSPFQFLFDGADNLRFRVTASVAVTVTFALRKFTPEGKLQVYQYVVAAAANRVTVERDVPIGQGYAANIVAFISSGSGAVGQVYVQAFIIRGLSGATVIMGQLLGQYVTTQQPAAWPGSVITPSTDGRGAANNVTVANPGAGNAWSLAVPTGARWQIFSVGHRQLATSTVGTRAAGVMAISSTFTTLLIVWSPLLIGASSSGLHFYTRAVDRVNLGAAEGVAQFPSDFPILAGGGVLSRYSGPDAAGDEFQDIAVNYHEWLEVP